MRGMIITVIISNTFLLGGIFLLSSVLSSVNSYITNYKDFFSSIDILEKIQAINLNSLFYYSIFLIFIGTLLNIYLIIKQINKA